MRDPYGMSGMWEFCGLFKIVQTGPAVRVWCDQHIAVKFPRVLHSVVRARNRADAKTRTGTRVGCDWAINHCLWSSFCVRFCRFTDTDVWGLGGVVSNCYIIQCQFVFKVIGAERAFTGGSFLIICQSYCKGNVNNYIHDTSHLLIDKPFVVHSSSLSVTLYRIVSCYSTLFMSDHIVVSFDCLNIFAAMYLSQFVAISCSAHTWKWGSSIQ